VFKRNGSAFRVLFTEAEVWAIRESLADLVCSRCGQKYRVHWNADHFFEHLEDLDPTEAD
jgi:hypothetical protein